MIKKYRSIIAPLLIIFTALTGCSSVTTPIIKTDQTTPELQREVMHMAHCERDPEGWCSIQITQFPETIRYPGSWGDLVPSDNYASFYLGDIDPQQVRSNFVNIVYRPVSYGIDFGTDTTIDYYAADIVVESDHDPNKACDVLKKKLAGYEKLHYCTASPYSVRFSYTFEFSVDAPTSYNAAIFFTSSEAFPALFVSLLESGYKAEPQENMKPYIASEGATEKEKMEFEVFLDKMEEEMKPKQPEAITGTEEDVADIIKSFYPIGASEMFSNTHVYENKEYGFRLELPGTWKMWGVAEVTEEGGLELKNGEKLMKFGIPFQHQSAEGKIFPLYKLHIYSLEAWNKLYRCTGEEDWPCWEPEKLGEKNGMVFALYFGGHELVQWSPECGKSIIKTFEPDFCDAVAHVRDYSLKEHFQIIPDKNFL